MAEQKAPPTYEELADKLKETTSALNELKRSANEKIIYSEAVYSFNILLKHPRFKTNGQFTIRGRAGEDGEAFMWRVMGMLNKAETMGWKNPIDDAQGAPAQGTPVQVAAPPIATANVVTGAAQTFPAATLSATVDGGKAYWKIKGGHWEKFGVTVYPEVLVGAGFTTLDPLKTYDLTGWIATYALKEDGKPAKVTALARAA